MKLIMRMSALLCALCLLLPALSVTSYSDAYAYPGVSAKSACLVDVYGREVYSKNSHVALPMASTTKIVTAVVAIENMPTDTVVTVGAESAGVEGSSAYLEVGEQLTLLDLLYALLLQSANDAATAIAVCVGGSVEDFAVMMNDLADKLELENTHFTNPHGLDDPDHYTTAYDLAKIALYALQNPIFAEIVATKLYVSQALTGRTRSFVNHNRMLFEYDGCIGVKTGYTQKDGRCLVSAAKRDGVLLVCVTLDAPSDWIDHKAMLNYGFSQYSCRVVADVGQFAYTLPVVNGTVNSVTCANTDELSAQLRDSDIVTAKLHLRAFEYAPVLSGSEVGTVQFFCGEIELGSVILYAESDADQLPDPTLWQRIVAFFRDLFDS